MSLYSDRDHLILTPDQGIFSLASESLQMEDATEVLGQRVWEASELPKLPTLAQNAMSISLGFELAPSHSQSNLSLAETRIPPKPLAISVASLPKESVVTDWKLSPNPPRIDSIYLDSTWHVDSIAKLATISSQKQDLIFAEPDFDVASLFSHVRSMTLIDSLSQLEKDHDNQWKKTLTQFIANLPDPSLPQLEIRLGPQLSHEFFHSIEKESWFPHYLLLPTADSEDFSRLEPLL